MRKGDRGLLILVSLVVSALVVALLFAPRRQAPHRVRVVAPVTSTTVAVLPPVLPARPVTHRHTPPTTTTTVPAVSSVTIPCGNLRVTGRTVTLTTVVTKGETLSAIAEWFDLYGGYLALYNFNRATVGPNPNLIFVGEVLHEQVPLSELPKVSKKYLAASAIK